MDLDIKKMEKIASDAYLKCTDPAGSVCVYEGVDEAAIMTPTKEYTRGILEYLRWQLGNYYLYNYGGKIYAAWE